MTAVALSSASPLAPGRLVRMPARLLRLPLIVKLAGANLVVVSMAWLASYAHQAAQGRDWQVLVVLGVALAAGLAVNLTLLVIALRPIRALQQTAIRLQGGDWTARVPQSPVTDEDLENLTATINALLDNLRDDRDRMRALSSEIIRVGDLERASVSRQLHESLAQTLAGLNYQLTALEGEANEPINGSLRAAREVAALAMEETRRLSEIVHPRVLDDFGLVAGLRHLAKILSGGGSHISVCVASGSDLTGLSGEKASVLYRIAEEACRNALRHARAGQIDIAAGSTPLDVWMEVMDDGAGFDPQDPAVNDEGMGLFMMRQRIALAGGSLAIRSAPGRGTVVSVRVPRAVSNLSLPPIEPAEAPVKPRLSNAR
jgi:signal transduction histidine kinase